MKKQHFVIVFAIFIFSGFSSLKAQDTIPMAVTPDSLIGMCLDNNFSVTFTATGLHRLTISAQLFRNGNPDTVFYCSDPVQKPKLFIMVDSTSTSISNSVTDTTNGTWTGTLDTNATITIWYHVYLDCSSINWPNAGTSNLNLVQTFTDSLNYFYNTGGGMNTFESSNLPGLRLIAPINLTFSTSYLDTTFLLFPYVNTGDGSADILFSFTPDTTFNCGQVTYDSLEYAVGINGNFLPFQPMTLTPASIGGNDTLFIRQQLLTSTCISLCDSARVSFLWQCAQPPANDSIFCNNCTAPLNTSFILENDNQSKIGIKRILPTLSEATFDNTCFNDTASMMSWHFQITNDGIGALDSVQIVLVSADSLEYLSLIPQNTFSINATCANCVDTLITYQRTNYLCQNFVPDALRSATFRLLDFRENDTVNVHFQTFRCASSDTLLFNIPKKMNSWSLRVLGKGICQDTAVHNLVGNPFFGFTQLGNISSHVTNGLNDVSLSTVFTPIISDLTVPQDSVFGQSATFEVQFNGGISANDRQVLGCLTSNCTSLNGYLKATVHCEQGLVIRNPSSDVKIKMFQQSTNSFLQLNPVYYHTLNPADTCLEGDYSFYFDLSDPLFKNVLDSGIFEFMLQSCCEQIEPTIYGVSFSILANPDSCLSLAFPPGHTLEPVCSGLGCAWIPLRKIENQIHVHCPGCVTPGMIVDNYVLRRTTFGLKDSDNDGLADSAAVFVNADTTYFNTHGIKTYHSTIGDELEDLLVSHFQQGDATNGGYEYSQMLPLGARLNFLQLRREIPAGLDTMQLTPVAFTFYVDSTDFSNPDCRDCEFFGVDTSRYRTMLQIHVDHTDTLFNTFLEFIPTENRLLFSFESSLDSSLDPIGNLHDYDSLIVHADTQLPFHGFYENQQYRLHVTYQQCSTLITSQLELNTQEDISTRSPIENIMWLSGIKQPHDAYPNQLQPTDTTALHLAGWTFDPLDPDTSRTLVDSSFANEYVFYCSGYGRIHYFYFQNITFSARALNDTSCGKKLAFSTGIRTRASNIKAFPYEYRPAPLWHKQIDAFVPPGYYIAQARVQSEYFIPPVGYKTAWRYFNTNDTTGNILLSDSSWMLPVVFYDHLFPTLTDSNLYVMSERSTIYYELLLATDSCIMAPQVYPDSSIVYNFGLTPLPYAPTDSTFCQIDPPIVRSSLQSASHTLVLQPNLNGLFIPSQVEVADHLICFNLKVNNEPIPLDSPATVYSTGAPYVFLALPDLSSVPFLNNWFYVSAGDTIYPNGNIIPIDHWLSAGDSISANVCAFYNPCQDSIVISMWLGWDCEGFPSVAFDPDSVCGAAPVPVTIKDLGVAMNPGAKDHLNEYSLCQAVEISAPFTSQLNGGYLPQAISLSNLFTGLTPLYAFINQCNSPVTDTLQLQSPWLWNITGSNLASIGIADSTLHATECIRITIGLLPECAFVGKDTLPTMNLFGETFCGDTISFQAQFSGTFHWDSTSHCTDCFTIEKTALQDTVFVGDTATYQIVLCGTNALSQTLAFTDLLPPGFTPLITVPDSVAVQAIGCDTLFISGTYSQAGFCSDSSMWNTATIYFAGDSLSSQACINVYPECVAGLPFISVPDSSFTTSIPATVTGQIIFLEDRLYVDDPITFVNCSIFVNTGGQIILQPGGSIILDSTIIQGCDHMWQGIITDTLTSVAVTNGSTIRDANRGVEARDGSTLKITHSAFENNVWGIYVPANSNGNNISHTIYGNRFGLFAPSLKPAYPSQAPFGSVPYAGVEVNDVVMSIGTSLADSNWFYKMNVGVIGHRSAIKVENNKFEMIQTDTSLLSPNMWDGTAITSIGDFDSSIVGKLIVRPVASGAWTIENCRQGVYTDYSELDVQRVDMTGVETGVASRHCTDMLTSIVDGCKIETRGFGIDWRLNAGSGGMRAIGNYIYNTGNNSVGIWMREQNLSADPVYQVNGNYVETIDGLAAIAGMRLYGADITWNIVKLIGTPAIDMTGIGIQANDSSLISCNYVHGDDESDTLKTAYLVSISDRTQVTCNVADSTGRGFSFGGIAPSLFRGNAMKEHFVGLYLNNVAVIDTQTHSGNRWIGNYSSGYGAVNLNAAQPSELVKSLFVVDPNLGSDYNPLTPPHDSLPPFYVDDNGWFFLDPDAGAFDCGSAGFCTSSLMGGGSEELRMSIVADDTLTVGYIPESKTMAKQYLFEQLKNDSVLLDSKTEYQVFVSNHENQNIGYLYEVKMSLADIMRWSQSEKQTITSVDSLIKFYTDSILVTDSLALADTATSYVTVRGSLISQLRTQINQRAALLQGQWVNSITHLTAAQSKNNLISGGDDPVSNEKTVNAISIQYLLYGKDGIVSHYSTLLGIATQCPYKGGMAVFRARVLLSLFNDTLVYDDAAVCLQEGIYRSLSSDPTPKRSPISIKPNPANEKVEIVLHGAYEGVCSVQIMNALGNAVLQSKFNCLEKKQTVDISGLVPGAYTVRVWINKDFNVHKKLVVIP